MERAGPQRDDLPCEKRRAAGVVHEPGRCRAPFSPELSAWAFARSERAHDRRRHEPAPGRSASWPRDRGRLGAGNAVTLKDDAGIGGWIAPGRSEHFPASARDAIRFAPARQGLWT